MSTVNSNYITCPKGHKVFVVWIEEKNCFAFTCDECEQTSRVAISIKGFVICTLKNN